MKTLFLTLACVASIPCRAQTLREFVNEHEPTLTTFKDRQNSSNAWELLTILTTFNGLNEACSIGPFRILCLWHKVSVWNFVDIFRIVFETIASGAEAAFGPSKQKENEELLVFFVFINIVILCWMIPCALLIILELLYLVFMYIYCCTIYPLTA